MTLGNMLGERGSSQKPRYLGEMFGVVDRNFGGGQGLGRRTWGVTANGRRVSFWGDRNAPVVVLVAQL
jgi:hypothetical protein